MTEEADSSQQHIQASHNQNDAHQGDILSPGAPDSALDESKQINNSHIQTGQKNLSSKSGSTTDVNKQNETSANDEPYSTFTEPQKIVSILIVSFAALVSPLSASTYYPSINSLAEDFGVSVSLMNLSITVYQILQGIGPSFVGNFSDRRGRRPAFIILFTIYFFANIGLALQDSYPALMVLRCVQSIGGAPTMTIGLAVVTDLVTRAERGKYMVYALMGVTLGPAFGPVIGGLLSYYLGWRAVFWFLAILSGILFAIVLVALPETGRNVVGNGDIRPPKWNLTLLELLGLKKRDYRSPTQVPTRHEGRRRTNPLASLFLLFQKETAILLLYSGLINAGYFGVLGTLTSQLKARYNYSSVIIGLCYLPMGLGALTSRWTAAPLLDRNFRRHAAKQGIEIVKNRQPDIDKLPIEMIRLQITAPLVFMAAISICIYGWVMEFRTSVAGPLVMLFFMGSFMAGATTSIGIMIMDIHQKTPATAGAANNLVRCLMSAAATGVASPLIESIGIGWTGTIITFLLLLFSPCLFAVMKWGPTWRKQLEEKKKRKEQQRREKRNIDPEAATEK